MADAPAPRVPPAVLGFDRAAGEYERARPDYPPAAIDHVARQLRLGPDRVLLDLGAGTGKLTRAFRPYGPTIVAVEPIGGMRREFALAVPGAELLDGTAEAIPRPDASCDAVVSGQAFHWFRAEEAAREIARVLRPLGGVALLWNHRDESVPWVARFGAILEPYRGTTPRAATSRGADVLAGSGLFEPLRVKEFRFAHGLSPDGVVDRALSVGFVALQPEEVRARIAERVRELVATEPSIRGLEMVPFPYRTEVFVTHRR